MPAAACCHCSAVMPMTIVLALGRELKLPNESSLDVTVNSMVPPLPFVMLPFAAVSTLIELALFASVSCTVSVVEVALGVIVSVEGMMRV